MSDTQKTLMFYMNSIEKGGAERVIVQLSGRFAEAGYRCVLVTSYAGEEEYALPDGVTRVTMESVKREGSRIAKNISRISALRGLIKKYRPAVLISFMVEPNFRSLIATAGLNVKTLVSVRNDPNVEYGGRLGGFVGKYLMPRADACVFQTQQASEWFSDRLRKKSKIIMNQVSPAFFDAHYSGERRDVVTAGRLNMQKNHKMLIRAFSRIAGSTEANLRIYGEGVLENELRELISELRLEGRVKLMGLSANVAQDIRDAKLFVMSSDFEGMPNALLEAMALGLACISTDCPCGGPKAIIEDGVNGMLVPVGGEEELAEKMLRLLSNPDEAAQMGEAARRTADEFRPEKVFAQWREYVEELIAQ